VGPIVNCGTVAGLQEALVGPTVNCLQEAAI